MDELLKDAISLFNDHPKQINDLIYWACTLDDEERACLILAYSILYFDKDEEEK